MKNSLLRLLTVSLLTLAAGFAAVSPAAAEDMTCPTPIMVTIDVKPGDANNVIKLSSTGLTPVAVLTTDSFDAAQFAPEMAHLSDAALGGSCAGASAVRWKLDDVNGDGLIDQVFFFRTADLGLTTSTTAVTFMAHGAYEGTTVHIMGTDSVIVKP